MKFDTKPEVTVSHDIIFTLTAHLYLVPVQFGDFVRGIAAIESLVKIVSLASTHIFTHPFNVIETS